MEFIKSVLPIIDQKLFAQELQGSKMLLALFNVMVTNSDASDEEARIALVNGMVSKQAFKQLRLRFRQKLIDFILKNDANFKRSEAFSQNRRICMNTVAIITYLTSNNARSAAASIAETTIVRTIKSEYTDLTVMLASQLYGYFSVINYNSRKQRKYINVLTSYSQLYNKELELNSYACELQSYFTRSASGMKEKILPRALVYDKIAADYLESSLISYGLLLNAYLIIAIRYELSGNYDRLLSTCQEAIDKFNGRTIKREIAVFMFDIRRIICQIQMGLHEDVDKVAEAHYNKMTVGSQNWFMLKMYHAISKFHSRRYSEVKDILNEVQGNREYNKLSQAIKQIWTVIEAYVEFIIAIGIIPSNHHSQFRINRFLNELTIFTKDKKGINIAILIIQVIFLLQQHKYSQIIDRTDALKQYCYRYLKKDDTFRSNCFIQMLLQMPRADFNRQRTARYAEPYLLRLQSVPLRVSEQTIEVEVIPYEDLWEMTLKLLD